MQNKRLKISVIKVGGSLLEEQQFLPWLKELSHFLKSETSVLVHGGGKEITALSARLGIKSHFIHGRRVTDPKMMEVVEMVLSGKVNPYIVSQLNLLGVRALGLSGRDREMVQAKAIPALGQVGKPNKIKSELIRSFLLQGLTPVFSSVAQDSLGKALNVNADEMAASIAQGLAADRLVLFTDVPGILDSKGKTISLITLDEGKKLIKEKIITGGMITKCESAFEALKKGVKQIWILEGRLPLKKSKGTLIVKKFSNHFKQPFLEIK